MITVVDNGDGGPSSICIKHGVYAIEKGINSSIFLEAVSK